MALDLPLSYTWLTWFIKNIPGSFPKNPESTDVTCTKSPNCKPNLRWVFISHVMTVWGGTVISSVNLPNDCITPSGVRHISLPPIITRLCSKSIVALYSLKKSIPIMIGCGNCVTTWQTAFNFILDILILMFILPTKSIGCPEALISLVVAGCIVRCCSIGNLSNTSFLIIVMVAPVSSNARHIWFPTETLQVNFSEGIRRMHASSEALLYEPWFELRCAFSPAPRVEAPFSLKDWQLHHHALQQPVWV